MVNLYTNQLLCQARAHPSFASLKWQGVFLLPALPPTPQPPGCDASPTQGNPRYLSFPVPIYTSGWRALGSGGVTCLAQNTTLSPARAQTPATRSVVKCTNHEVATPPQWPKDTHLSLFSLSFWLDSFLLSINHNCLSLWWSTNSLTDLQ